MRPRDFQILLVLCDRPLHAYGLSKQVEQQTGGAVKLEIGSLYRMVGRLMAWGLIEEEEDTGKAARDKRRRYYRITSLGRRVAGAEALRLEEVVELARVKRLLPGGGSV